MTSPSNGGRKLRGFAQSMRKSPTPAEGILWQVVRHRRLAGYRFRRQHPFGPYILDFYCAVARLVVELDGDSHLEREQHDRQRDDYLREQGIHVLRIPNSLVYEEKEGVLEMIARMCAERAGSNAKVRHKIDEMGRFHFRPDEMKG
jgi:very-short-patch-repair endonuclease